MFKCLVSGGCSFAYGFNLRDRNKRYAKILANHMQCELIDVSAAGMTNEFIAAATISGITKALNNYKAEEILVIVGWTTTERFEYFNKSLGRIMSGYVNPSVHLHGDKLTHDQQKVAEVVSKYMWDPSYGFYKLIHAFNYVYAFCKQIGVSVINKHNVNHYSAEFPNIPIKHTDIMNRNLIENAVPEAVWDCYKTWSTEKSFQDFCLIHKLVIDITRDTHPNEEGHKRWAERLIIKHKELSGV